ncbi:hypothetical protein Oter_2210 [Opitutus terrae PB90-1]|uniref:Uncharacterized protein n=2 Tax=Opitutus terrae TaxID=107709 RepID=B1ZPP0_OPITP|nr:hypothetical protein Oter_2210 [Opitutus terrae PB90-1]
MASALLAAVLICGAACTATRAAERGGGQIHARIVDDATGATVAARVALTDGSGKAVEVAGEHPHVDCLNKRWCYVGGEFTAVLPSGDVMLEIRRGIETRPFVATLRANSRGPAPEKTFRLQRWFDRRKAGFVAGDIHAHLPVPAEARFHMEVEDLDTQVLLHMADSVSELPTNALFTGKLDEHSTPEQQIFVGQEVREWHMGHLTLLGLKELVPGYPDMGGGLEYWRSVPHLDLTPAARATRAQGGMIAWSHLCSLPGAESPVLAALGLLDAIELVTWNDPTTLPNHLAPWQESGFSQAEFPVMRALDLYYTLLNAGFRLPVAAGTDKFFEDIPLGSNRTYAHTGSVTGFDAWLAAIKAGRSFVTNGPILEFEVDNHRSGDVIEFNGSRQVRVRAKARSILPFAMIEIIHNGRSVAHRTVYGLEPVDGLYTMEVDTAVRIDESSWLAARVAEHPDIRRPILPRGLSVFAHTSPIYFLDHGKPVREGASIAYLQKYVRGLLHWLDGQPDFLRASDRAAAREAAEQALAYYERL